MEWFGIDYRDPIFGIMIFFIIIFLVSFMTYSYTIYKERQTREEHRKLLERFNIGELKQNDYIALYKEYKLPFDSIIFLATTFLHKGQYNKAIGIYLSLLEHINDEVKKEELLELLGIAYFKGGFLQRARDVFLKIVKIFPRNKIALEHLLIIYEKLKDYSMCEDVIESLHEIDVDVFRERFYIATLKIIDDSTKSYEVKTKELLAFFKINRITQRLVVQFLLQFNKKIFWQMIDKFNHIQICDHLWHLDFDDIDFDKVSKHSRLQEIYTAKGYIKDVTHSDIFELYVLITLNQEGSKLKADLNFEYICTKCKNIYPVYSNRCPNCHAILTSKVEPILSRKVNIETSSTF